MITAKLLLDTACLSDHADIVRLRVSGFGTRELPTSLNETTDQIDTDMTQQTTLLLLDEEAFFLCEKGELRVVNSDNESATIDSDVLWKIFCGKNKNFPTKYAVYSYFKTKNYIVRTGINFGVDYCVYHALPSVCHSEMCVTVMDAWSSGQPCIEQSNTTTSATTDTTTGSSSSSLVWQDQTSAARMDKLSWRHVTTLTRVIPDVMKLCVICYVMPASWSQTSSNSQLSERAAYLSQLFPGRTSAPPVPSIDSSSPACLGQLQVHCATALVRRLPAPSATYQSIGQIQAVYQKGSTAQKKKENQAAMKKQHQHQQQRLAAVVAGVYQQRAHTSSGAGSKSTSIGADVSTSVDVRPPAAVDAAVSVASTSVLHQAKSNTQATVTSTAATAPIDISCTTSNTSSLVEQQLSARQKRVAKFLLKAQKQQKPSGSERRERRDHHESRGKILSQKNQTLLQLMEGQDSEGGGSATTSNDRCNSNSTTCTAETTRVSLLATSAGSMDPVGIETGAVVQPPAISCVSSTVADSMEGPALKRKFCDINSSASQQETVAVSAAVDIHDSSTVQAEAKRPRLSLSAFSCTIL